MADPGHILAVDDMPENLEILRVRLEANGYRVSTAVDGDECLVTDGRHPVVEQRAAAHGEPFVPNDVVLNGGTSQLVILTGPNMGGKSTYLRQVALLSIMAQAGSFVPARDAKLALVDRIFARVFR